jgi:hypothetical protein
MGVFDIVMEKPAEVSRSHECVWYSHGKTCWSQSHRYDGLLQVFPWLYQTHPSTWLMSAGFSMTISNKPIASTDFTRFFHDYIKHTHRLDWLQQVFPWLGQAHTSLTDFSRFFHHYIKHTLRFDWLQQVFPWLYQTHPSIRLTSAGFWGDGCVRYSHRNTCWSKSKRWVCLI